MSSRAQLFVGRLPIDVRERDVEQLFEKYGRLLRCDVKYGMYGSTGRRGSGRTGMAYAFVDYEDRRDAEDAVKYENGREMRGQSIVVEWARGPSYRSGGGSGYQRSSSYRSSEECYRCRRTGHWARDCPELERDRYYPRTSRYRSRSRSRSRSYRRRRSVTRSRSRSRDRRRSVSRDKHTKQRSISRSVTKSLSRSRSRSRGKTHKKSDKSSKSKERGATKSPSRSRTPTRSRSPLAGFARASRTPQKSPEYDNHEGNHQSSEADKFRGSASPSPHRSLSKEKNRESDAGSYHSASRSKSR